MVVTMVGGFSIQGQLRSYQPPDLTVKFVAVSYGSNSNIYTSADGVSWILSQASWMPSLQRVAKIIHDGTKWVVMGLNNLNSYKAHFATSVDGINWTTTSVSGNPWPAGYLLAGITFANSNYVGVVRNNIYQSTNLTNWTNAQSLDSLYNSNAYNIWSNPVNGALYAVVATADIGGGGPAVFRATTPSGTWTQQFTQIMRPAISRAISKHMVFTSTKKVYVNYETSSTSGSPAAMVANKPTAGGWTKITSHDNGGIGLAYGNNVILSSTASGIVRRANDAENPSFAVANNSAGSFTNSDMQAGFNTLAFGSDKFVLVTNGGVKYSTDNGSTWTLSDLTANNIICVGSKASF